MKEKAITIKTNEINKIKIKIEIKAKRGVNSEIRISIIIFTMREPLAKRASTRNRRFKIIKSSVNMFFIERLCDIRACEKMFFNLFKCEQCDLNHIII